MIRRAATFAVLTLTAVVALAGPAGAHVELEPGEAMAGSTTLLTFTVQHGKDGAATTGVTVQLPEGASVVDVPAKDGWTSDVDEVERTVAWTGGSAPGEEHFEVNVQLPNTPGEVLFPTLQDTVGGELAWIDQTEGDSEDSNPAPRLTLTPDPNSTTTSTTEATTTTTAGTTTTNGLPGTTLEADERDDGTTNAAPWIIGSGIAAVVAIAVGGTLLKRRQDRQA